MDRFFFVAGSLLAFFAVALGAFAAHGLKTRLSPDMFNIFEVGVRYHMYHALALLAVAWACSRWPESNAHTAAGRSSSALWFFPAAFTYSASPACAGSARLRRSAGSVSSSAGFSLSGLSGGKNNQPRIGNTILIAKTPARPGRNQIGVNRAKARRARVVVPCG